MEVGLQVFDYEGCPIHYRLMGPEDGMLVVLTHGGMVDHRIWEPQVKALVSRYRLLLWDVRGHGRSRPGGKKRSIFKMAEDLAALLDFLGYSQAVLVGLSAGGWLVQEFAYRYPERVIAMAVIGQTSWTQPPFKVRLMLGSWSALLFMLVCLLIPWKFFVGGLMRAGAANAKPQTLAYLGEVFGAWTKAEFIYHTLYARGLRRDEDYRVSQPLLIAHGEHEMDFVQKDAAAWAKREPRSRYGIIPDAGHAVNMDNPAAFNELMLDFLAGVENG
ncbi:alpha/beta fold hydrolase [Dethiobacter alkaliphilus]|uniref:alpha/beta fold hydrolase n=1 Tax=Dethiobacter alkaliphilus TaxID=427926 RepID=UPI002225F80B|nr:alpha/beta hydrolase [Dethiobacter alkaliphilus]MCW3489478.1 alpha/beta hydrolase [Dethiobacter alkaliphilus]